MPGQADGSIIVDTEINPEGFKAGSSELLAAIKSLSSEVKELGKILKAAFSNNNRGIASTDGYVQQLEATVSSLKAEVQSLQTKIAKLQDQLNGLGKTDTPRNSVSQIAESAQVADERVTELESEVKRLEGIITALYAKLNSVTSAPAEVVFDTSEAESKIEYLETKIGELENTIAELQNSGGSSVNVSGTAGKTSSLQKQIESTERSVQRLEPTFEAAMEGSSKSMTTFKARAAELEAKIKSLRHSLAEFSNTPATSNEIKALEKDLAGVAKSISSTEEKMAKASVGLQAYERELSDIRKSTKAMLAQSTTDEQRANVKQLESAQIEALNQKYASQIRIVEQLAAKLSELDVQQQMLNQRMGEAKTNAANAHFGAINGMKAQIDSATSALVRMKAQAAQAEAKAHGISGAFRKVGTAVRAAAKSAGGLLLRGLKKALQITKSLILHNNKYGKSFQKLRSLVGRFSLGLLGVRAIYGVLTKAVSKYMESNQALSNQLESCWTSLGNLLGPLITRIINLVTTAISYVTAFLKLLGITGSAAAAATKEAGDAAEKAQHYLAGFDELNVMPDKSSSGGGADSKVEPIPDAELPKWVEDMVGLMKSGKWAEAANTLTDNLNRLMSEVDWAGIGNKVGKGLDDVLEFLATTIKTFDWEGLGSNLATSLNGIISNVDWGNLGVVLTGGLAVLMKTLTGFFSTLDGAESGNAIHEFIRGGIDACDWVGCAGRLSKAISDFLMAIDFQQIGKDLSDMLRTALQTMISAVTNFDWRGLGQKIADFINSIDWAGLMGDIAQFVSDILVGALDLLVGFIENVDWGKLATDLFNGLVNMISNIDFAKIISLAFELAVAALGAATQLVFTLLNQLWKMLCSGWESTKSYFADYIEESGGNIIEGLLNGMLNALSNIGQWVVENIFQPFMNGFCDVFGIHSPSTVMAEQGGFLVEGLYSGISNNWPSISDFLSEGASKLVKNLSGRWKELFSNTKKTWEKLKSTVTSEFDDTENEVHDSANNMQFNLDRAFSSIFSDAKTAWNNLQEVTLNKFSALQQNVLHAWINLRTSLNNVQWNNVGHNLVTGLNNGVAGAWGGFMDNVTTMVNNLIRRVKNLFGIHSPSRVFAEIGEFLDMGLEQGMNDGKRSLLTTAKNIATAVTNGMTPDTPNVQMNVDSVVGSMQAIISSLGSLAVVLQSIANAITEEIGAGQYGKILLPIADVDGVLTSFTDKITDNFTALLNKMDAIAKNVGFTVPAFAGSVAPYAASSGYTAKPTNQAEMSVDASIMTAVLAELQTLSRIVQNLDVGQSGDTKVIINGREVFQTIVDENNRAIMRNGKSPLRV